MNVRQRRKSKLKGLGLAAWSHSTVLCEAQSSVPWSVPYSSCFPRMVGVWGSSNTKPQETYGAALWFTDTPWPWSGQRKVPILPGWTPPGHLGSGQRLRWKHEVTQAIPAPCRLAAARLSLAFPKPLLQGTLAMVWPWPGLLLLSAHPLRASTLSHCSPPHHPVQCSLRRSGLFPSPRLPKVPLPTAQGQAEE